MPDRAERAARARARRAARGLGIDDTVPSPCISVCTLDDAHGRCIGCLRTIEEIRDAHMLNGDDLYELRKNYRNTREIGLFARTFYVGLQSGQPDVAVAKPP